jgi:hypothetical protein
LLENEDLWPAEDHIIAESPAHIRPTFEVPIPLTIAQQLRFESYPQSKSLRFVEPGVLDQQTLRGVRELDYGSAQLLDTILSAEKIVYTIAICLKVAPPKPRVDQQSQPENPFTKYWFNRVRIILEFIAVTCMLSVSIIVALVASRQQLWFA